MISSRTIIAFAVVAVVLFGSQVGLYQASADQAQAASWVPETYQAIEAMRSISDGVALAESSLRGFAVTREPSALPVFEQGIARSEAGLAAARDFTRDSALQQQRLHELEPIIALRLAQLQEAMQLARAGEPADRVVTRERLRMSDALRASVDNLIATERALLSQRLAQSAAQTERAERIALFGMLLATVLCGSGLWVITRQNRTLRDAEEELRLTVDQAPIGIGLVSPERQWLRVNDALCRILGQSRDQLLRKPYMRTLHPDDRAAADAHIDALLGGHAGAAHLKLRCLRDADQIGFIEVTASLVRTSHGAPRFLVADVQDISAQVEREQALHVLQEAIAATSSGVLLTDPTARDNPITYINPAFAHMTGYSAEELLGRSCRILQGHDREQPGITQLRAAIQAQRECKVVLRNYRKNGELFLNAITISPVLDASGALVRYIGISEDVTERRREEEQMRMLASITRRITEQQPLDSALKRILCEVCESQGWDYGELWREAEQGEGLTCQDVCYARKGLALEKLRERGTASQDAGMVQRVWKSARPEWCEDLQKEGESFSRRIALLREAGLRTAVAVAVGPGEGVLLVMRSTLLPEDTRILHLLTTVAGQLGMFIQRKRAELALHTSEERLSYATRATSDVVFDCVLSNKQLWLSEAALRNFGYDVTQVSFDWWAERLHPNDASGVLSTLQAACAGDQTHWTYEYRFACSNDRYAHVFHRLFILRDEQGKPIRLIGSMMDVSERVRNEEALREAKISAEAAARAKTAFLANMSHEIRTPLTALLGFADLLLDPSLENVDRLSYATIIRSNGEHLLAVLNDVLDVAKIESGKLTIEHVEFSPAKMLAEVASLMRVKALEKGLSFSAAADAPLPAAVRADPTRLRQILLNLISNAVKFTESGSVRVTARCGPAPQGSEAQLEIRVSDTGIGMDETQVQRLFQPFFQGDSSTTRRFGGTGLGLAICGPLVRAMGGVIEVKTKPHEGSEFTVRLPVEIGEGTQDAADLVVSAAPPEAQSGRGSVLLAEDGPDNQRLISTILRQRGFEVEVVDNGLHAVERALSAAKSGAAFDVILMDMQMPRLDGYQATARLRASGYQRPILALTAHAMEGERKRCLDAGCDEHLAKPIQREVLLRAVASHVQRAQRPANDQRTAQPRAAQEADASGHLSSNLANDAELRDLIAGFVAGLPAQVAALRSAADKDDREQLSRLVHQLKGAAGGYGFPSISDAARALEGALRADPAGPLPAAWHELLRLCESTQPRAQGTPSNAAQTAPANVLVVEDSALIRELVAIYLGGEGMQLRYATCAREGLSSAYEQTPDVILLDIELPDMSGLNVCRELKQDVRTASVPVLFLTGTEDNVVKATAFELGAIDYVTKPFDKIELRARVRSALRVKRYQDLLTTRAQIDGLTGLWNRAFFDVRLREEIASARRHHRALSIALLDVDHFKKVNDNYGHPFGDYVLQRVAGALVGTLRTGDVACRYGGEELVVILRDTSMADATVAAERMLRVISELPLINRGQSLHVTVSIGVTTISDAAVGGATPKHAELLIEAADSALYRAKREGRARVVLNPIG